MLEAIGALSANFLSFKISVLALKVACTTQVDKNNTEIEFIPQHVVLSLHEHITLT